MRNSYSNGFYQQVPAKGILTGRLPYPNDQFSIETIDQGKYHRLAVGLV
jgi:hypothetical protein